MDSSNNKTNNIKGFTLIELVVVIVLLGIMSVGITSFINLSTQIYVNVADRDELIASARFAVERLNRELRNALPNSVRVTNDATNQCIEFVPIKASTVYTDIPVSPEPETDTITVIEFQDENGNGDNYDCPVNETNCSDKVAVYPLNAGEINAIQYDLTGKVFGLKSVDHANPSASEWTLTLDRTLGVQFDSDSPTKRLYIINNPVSFCVTGNTLVRYDINGFSVTQSIKQKSNAILMADNLADLNVADLPFVINPATLQRNANVQVKLHFQREGEDFVFNNDIHLVNVP